MYRGCALPDLRGTYFYSDFCAAFVRSFTYHNGAVENLHDWTAEIAPGNGQSIDRVVAFAEDGRGELYICDLGGEVFKIVPSSGGGRLLAARRAPRATGRPEGGPYIGIRMVGLPRPP